MLYFETKEHPSYGQLEITRTTIGGKKLALYGSSILHDHVISFSLKESKMDRGLNRDWYHTGKEIVRFEMSPSQFAEAITNMNVGGGVPVTLIRVNGEGIEECPFEGKMEQFQNEFAVDCKKVLENVNNMMKSVQERMNDKKPLTVKERDEITNMIRNVKQAVKDNIPFVMTSFNEQMDKTVTEAKAEFEASVQSRINALGIEALKNQVTMIEDGDKK